MRGRLLFVDDDPTIHFVARRVLGDLGFELTVRDCGAAALEEIRKRPFDVLLTDLGMPGMDGEELARQAIAIAPHTSFVFLTGRTDLRLRSTPSVDHAVVGIVQKPWDAEELRQLVELAFSRSQASLRPKAVKSPETVLLVEDDAMDALLLRTYLDRSGAAQRVEHVDRLALAEQRLGAGGVAAVFLDMSLPDARGFDGVRRLAQSAPEVPLLVVSGHVDDEMAVEALRLGAQDVLNKNALDPELLAQSIRFATARKSAERGLAERAHFDQLTGLANRSTFYEALRRGIRVARRTGTRVAVLFADLDGFKAVNDSYGHEAGDLLLREVARRLGGAVRDTDLAARLGGDEFAVLLPDAAGVDDAQVVRDRILRALDAPVDVGRALVTPQASIGIALGQARDGAAELMARADAAMYGSKRRSQRAAAGE
ncbi:MAG: diguanylate cyclase [Myxococcota bacterium]